MTPLRLERIVPLTVSTPGTPPDPGEHGFLTEYLTDLAAQYGFPPRPEVMTAPGHRFEEMVAALVTSVAPDRVDHVVLAFAVPDVRAGRTAASYRGGAVPGEPLAFAVCDQGTVAGFTALRLARGLGGRTLVLVVEQPALPYEPPYPVALPARAAGVALLCAAGTGPVTSTMDTIRAGVEPSEAAALLAGGEVGELIVGDGLVDTGSGQPLTGVWHALADALTDERPRTVVVADHEPDLRYLCTATFELRM